MAIYIKETQRDFTPVPAGTHLALCNLIADVGVQPSPRFAPRSQVYLRFELPQQKMTWKDRDGKDCPGLMQIGRFYTRSLAPKANLRSDLESWRGKLFSDSELKRFDLLSFLGKSCMLGVVHTSGTDRVFANIKTIMGAPAGTNLTPHGKLIAYDIESDDKEMFELLPEWLRQKIRERIVAAPKAKENAVPPALDTSFNPEEFDDNIPFTAA
jgi:hypothetical protein